MTPGSPTKVTQLVTHLFERRLAVTRAELTSAFGTSALRAAVASGRVMRILPGVYVATEHAEEPLVRARAAGVWAGGLGAVSGQAALAQWCPEVVMPTRITVELRQNVHREAPPWVRVVRPARVARRFRVNGVRVVEREDAAVQAWNESDGASGPGVMIQSVQSGCRAEQILSAAEATARVRDRAGLVKLLGLLDGGVTSYLEWIARSKVFTAKRFPDLLWQHTVVAAGRVRHPDAYDPEAKIALEFDGTGTHSKDSHRRADLERDADLAGIGILLLHFTTEDILLRPDWCIRKYLDARAARLAPAAAVANW